LNLLKTLGRLWYTGLLALLTLLGYALYAILYTIRRMQLKKLFGLVLLLAVIGMAGGAIWLLEPFAGTGREVVVTVEPGTSVRTVAHRLEERNVVRSARAFLAWLTLQGLDKSMQAGRYRFREHDGMLRAAEKLQLAEPIDTVVTVPEGLTVEQTAARLAEILPVDTVEFARLCRDSAFLRSLGITASSAEGYLFPDTYRLPPDAGAELVIRRMHEEFLERFAMIESSDVHQRLNRHEIVTLASIVEREATVAEERTHIAGVFHNRLRRGIPLGADPTVRYAIRKFSGPLRVSELNNDSPYNTRKHAGLPPGPICSPGLGALQAAVSPLETKDLYFVAKWDGSGEHDFSRTLREHERKKHRIRRENEARKRRLKERDR
jgi:UPF0755 protein